MNVHHGFAIPQDKLAAERAAKQAADQAQAAEIAAAIAQIPDAEFDAHPLVIEQRAQLAATEAELEALKRARPAIDNNPAPKRIAEMRAEIASREAALRAAELEAVTAGDMQMSAAVTVRAELRTLADLLAALESGWAQFLAAMPEGAQGAARLVELEQERSTAADRLAKALNRLKRERVTGEEERVLHKMGAVDALRQEREAVHQRQEEAMLRRRPRAAAFRERKAAALAGRPLPIER